MTHKCSGAGGHDPQEGAVVRKTNFCLCGRDPASAEVRKELIKAMALSIRYDMVQGGCLGNAAAAFDKIFKKLVPDEVRELQRVMQEIDSTLGGPDADSNSLGKAEPRKAWLH